MMSNLGVECFCNSCDDCHVKNNALVCSNENNFAGKKDLNVASVVQAPCHSKYQEHKEGVE